MRGALTTQDVAFALVRRSVLVEDVMVCKTAPWHATAPQTQASYSAAGPYIDLTRCPWGIAAGRQRGGPGGTGPPGPPACAQPASLTTAASYPVSKKIADIDHGQIPMSRSTGVDALAWAGGAWAGRHTTRPSGAVTSLPRARCARSGES
jgi:hypothetical protein